jgi:hypothetical protein
MSCWTSAAIFIAIHLSRQLLDAIVTLHKKVNLSFPEEKNVGFRYPPAKCVRPLLRRLPDCDESGFESWQGQEILHLYTASIPALGPIEPLIQWSPAARSPGVKPSTHSHLAQRSRMEWLESPGDLIYHRRPPSFVGRHVWRPQSFPTFSVSRSFSLLDSVVY